MIELYVNFVNYRPTDDKNICIFFLLRLAHLLLSLFTSLAPRMARVGNSRLRARVPLVYAPRLSGGSTEATPRPSTMPFNRLAARLAQMLLRPICTSARYARRVAPRVPLPDEIVERVLLSPDLVPHILGPLKAEDGAAAAVCSQWLAGWKETNEPRRRLREVLFDLPEELQTADDPLCSLHVAATPDGRLVASAFTENQLTEQLTVHILDRSMRVLKSVTDQPGSWSVAYRHPVAADDHSVYYVAGSHQPGSSVVMLRTSLDGSSAAEYGFHEGHDLVSKPVLAGGLLFCVISTYLRYGGDGQIEIFALDAQTMQLRHRFGRGLLFCEFSNVDIGVPGDGGEIVWRRCFARSGVPLAVGGDELYAGVANQNCLQVFSLTGVHRRSVRGEWRMPELSHLCVENDRVYLVAAQGADGDVADVTQLRSLLVLSKHGEILQVYTHSLPSWRRFSSIIFFDGKLLVSYRYCEYPRNSEKCLRSGGFALQRL